MIKQFASLYEMMGTFPDEQSCIDHLRSIRWKSGAYCPHCGANKVYHFTDNRNHKCGICLRRFSIKVGTIFEDSKISLRKWFMAIYLITSHKKGIASTQLAKDIKVTQKTAWFMLQRLRFATETKSFREPLTGQIEIDETYIGGKEKNKHAWKKKEGTQGRSTKTKAIVIGMIERGGEIRVKKLPDGKTSTVSKQVFSNVKEGSRVITDDFKSYGLLASKYKHEVVTHSVGEYSVGDRHTNTIEGVWSLLKRGIIGIYHHVSPKHLPFYLHEFAYRYNTIGLTEGQRVNALLGQCGGRITYKEVIA